MHLAPAPVASAALLLLAAACAPLPPLEEVRQVADRRAYYDAKGAVSNNCHSPPDGPPAATAEQAAATLDHPTADPIAYVAAYQAGWVRGYGAGLEACRQSLAAERSYTHTVYSASGRFLGQVDDPHPATDAAEAGLAEARRRWDRAGAAMADAGRNEAILRAEWPRLEARRIAAAQQERARLAEQEARRFRAQEDAEAAGREEGRRDRDRSDAGAGQEQQQREHGEDRRRASPGSARGEPARAAAPARTGRQPPPPAAPPPQPPGQHASPAAAPAQPPPGQKPAQHPDRRGQHPDH